VAREGFGRCRGGRTRDHPAGGCDRRRRGVKRLDTSTSDRDGNRDVATADTVAEYGESVTENYQPGRDCHGIPTGRSAAPGPPPRRHVLFPRLRPGGQ
jgi:hypothetical protein